MNANFNLFPLYGSVSIGNKHIFAGWCYKLEVYTDTSEEKPVTKTRKVGYHWFGGITEIHKESDGTDSYKEMIREWNRKSRDASKVL